MTHLTPRGFIDDCQSDGGASDAGQINYDFEDYIGREATPVKRTSDGKIREKTPELPNLFKAPDLIKKPKEMESEEDDDEEESDEDEEEDDEEEETDEAQIEMNRYSSSEKSAVFRIVNWPYNKDDPNAFYRMAEFLDSNWFYNKYHPFYGVFKINKSKQEKAEYFKTEKGKKKMVIKSDDDVFICFTGRVPDLHMQILIKHIREDMEHEEFDLVPWDKAKKESGKTMSDLKSWLGKQMATKLMFWPYKTDKPKENAEPKYNFQKVIIETANNLRKK